MIGGRLIAWWSEVLRRDRLHRQHIADGRRLREQQQRPWAAAAAEQRNGCLDKPRSRRG